MLTSRFIIILFLEIFVLRLTFLAKYHPLIQLSFKEYNTIYRHVVHCQTENKSCHPSTNMISSFCRKIFCLPFQFTAAVDMSILDFFLHENVAFHIFSQLRHYQIIQAQKVKATMKSLFDGHWLNKVKIKILTIVFIQLVTFYNRN